MTYKTLSGSYPSGYTIASGVTSISIAFGSYIGMNSFSVKAGLAGGASPSQITIVDTGADIYGYKGIYLDQPFDITNKTARILTSHGFLYDPGRILGEQVGIYTGSPGTVTNYGSITGGSVAAIDVGAGSSVVNEADGVIADTRGWGVNIEGLGMVTNLGTIRSTYGEAVSVFSGQIVNGSSADTTAAILSGRYAGVQSKSGTVTNYGTIEGSLAGYYDCGVLLTDGGRVVNGSAQDEHAHIEGGFGVVVQGAVASVVNSGVIDGQTSYGVELTAGGSLTNGSGSDPSATIEGAGGASLAGAGGRNFGLIEDVVAEGVGLLLTDGAFTNGAAGKASATIEGHVGAMLGAGAVLTNFGAIEGTGVEPAVEMTDATARLNIEAGSTIAGSVDAGPGTLDVVAGVAALSGLSAGGKVEGAGTLSLTSGPSFIDAGASLTVAKIAVASGVTVEIAGLIGDAKLWRQSGGTLAVDAGDRIDFTDAGDFLSGTLAGAGTIEFTAGSATLSNATLSAAKIAVSAANVVLSGAIDLKTTLTAPKLGVAAGGATLTGGGTVSLAAAATSAIIGGTATAELANGDTIRGAGKLGAGKLALTNQATGVIDANTTLALTIDTGSQTVMNAGIIESTSTGGLAITSAVANTGTIQATKGEVTLDGALTGSGLVRIVGGTVDLAASFSGAVAFGVAGGTLALAHSATDTVTVTGFSKTGASKLDLADIAFAKAKVSYTGTTKSGTLTVTDGTNTAEITLSGNYLSSTFTLATDGHGGTLVADPSAHAPAARFVAAAAAVGGGHGPPLLAPPPLPPVLVAPAA